MKKVCVFLLVVLLLLPALLFAGGQKEEKIVLTWYQWFDAKAHETELLPTIAEFEKIYPNVKVELAAIPNEAYWDRLALDIASGVEGDIVTLDTGAGLMGYYSQRPGGAFIPLDKYIKGYVLPDGTRLEEDILLIDSVKIEGNIMALPYIMFSAPMTAYRKSVLKEAGIDPSELTRWTSYYEAAKKLTKDVDNDGKIDVYGFGHPQFAETISRWWHMHWLWTAGGGIFPKEQPPYTADNLIFNSKENVTALSFLKKMLDETAPSGQKTVSELHSMFANGSLATVQIATWTLANFEEMISESEYRDDVAMVPFPAYDLDGKYLEPIYVSWGNPLAISSNCKHPKEAFDFIAFMHTKEAQKLAMRRASPTNILIYDEFAKIKPKQAEFVQKAQKYEQRIVPDIVEWNQFDRAIQESVKSALLGTSSIEEALASGEEEMRRALK
ncbi:MAG TPA: sugar ABC transporter substrate-binding protein [Candidatus Cloacimonas sp.]|jgi:multiple sugar transport system substrate-binding protein|nr:sugar ABC transporter substrate-binding protein [Candidatus Cloacimonas sp.]HPM10420.1 sugar ABC transporter substrate-binding protein [Paludibacter sp.]